MKEAFDSYLKKNEMPENEEGELDMEEVGMYMTDMPEEDPLLTMLQDAGFDVYEAKLTRIRAILEEPEAEAEGDEGATGGEPGMDAGVAPKGAM